MEGCILSCLNGLLWMGGNLEGRGARAKQYEEKKNCTKTCSELHLRFLIKLNTFEYLCMKKFKCFKIIIATFGGNDSIFMNIGTQEMFISLTFVLSLILYHVLLEFSTCSRKVLDDFLAFQAR